jgi:acetolactate decarboxylase
MKSLMFCILFLLTYPKIKVPLVNVSGAMKNIMMDGDPSSHINLDTLNKSHLFGLGPVAGLRGELIILDGKVYSTSKNENVLVNEQDKISSASMLVYSRVKEWKPFPVRELIRNYGALEKLVKATAEASGYDVKAPFAFKIEATPKKASYHVIHWEGNAEHSKENHKQFAYSGLDSAQKLLLLGFYSTHHQGIFTHHTTNMHVHLLNEASNVVGHLDDIEMDGRITIYLPVQ